MAKSFLQIELKTTGKVLSVSGNKLALSKDFEKALGDKSIQKKDLIEIGGMIKEQITANYINGKTFDGRKVAPLKPSTIKRKGHSRVFFEKGKLIRSVIVDSKGAGVVVRLKNDRAKIAEYLQVGNKNMKARPAFGITKKFLSSVVKTVIGSRLSRVSVGQRGFANLRNRKAV